VSGVFISSDSVCIFILLQVLVATMVVDEGSGKNSNVPGTFAQGERQTRSNGRFYSWSKVDCRHSRCK